MHYFLVDDSIEVREVQTANNGRDPFPIMSRRQMLPKSEAFDLAQLATTTPLGTDRDVQSKKGKFYTWQDLRIGSTLNVLGRKFVINDCDSYTRSFYAERLGLGAEEMKPLGQKNAHAHDEHVAHAELAESTVKKNNFFKMLENEGKHLRFGAMLESQHKEDEGRRFVVIYRLSDDTMSIYEPKIRNSGILGGKFMERATPINPDTNKPYTAADLFVGATIAVGRVFVHSQRA